MMTMMTNIDDYLDDTSSDYIEQDGTFRTPRYSSHLYMVKDSAYRSLLGEGIFSDLTPFLDSYLKNHWYEIKSSEMVDLPKELQGSTIHRSVGIKGFDVVFSVISTCKLPPVRLDQTTLPYDYCVVQIFTKDPHNVVVEPILFTNWLHLCEISLGLLAFYKYVLVDRGSALDYLVYDLTS
jgi:hypothetical protein